MRRQRLALILLCAGLLAATCNRGGGNGGLPPLTVAAFGDSLTSYGKWFPSMPSVWTMLDHGASGQICSEVMDRLETDLPATGADSVVILCGTNDVRRGGYSLEATVAEIELGVVFAQALGMTVVVGAPPPEFGAKEDVWNARLVALRDELALLADVYDVGFADAWTPFWNHPDPPSLYEDGVHPNAEGREILGGVILLALLDAN